MKFHVSVVWNIASSKRNATLKDSGLPNQSTKDYLIWHGSYFTQKIIYSKGVGGSSPCTAHMLSCMRTRVQELDHYVELTACRGEASCVVEQWCAAVSLPISGDSRHGAWALAITLMVKRKQINRLLFIIICLSETVIFNFWGKNCSFPIMYYLTSMSRISTRPAGYLVVSKRQLAPCLLG